MRTPPLVLLRPVALLLALAASPAFAANECNVVIGHFGDGAARRTPLTTTATLSVGDVSSQSLDWLDFLRNEGPHDIRITLDNAAPRQLSRGEVDPPGGRFRSRSTLRRIECLLTRP